MELNLIGLPPVSTAVLELRPSTQSNKYRKSLRRTHTCGVLTPANLKDYFLPRKSATIKLCAPVSLLNEVQGFLILFVSAHRLQKFLL